MIEFTFTADEQRAILNEAMAIDGQLIAIQQHMAATGTVIPMRTLGHWEEMRLDQRDIVMEELAAARKVATTWDIERMYDICEHGQDAERHGCGGYEGPVTCGPDAPRVGE
jgi:hypothetical protein